MRAIAALALVLPFAVPTCSGAPTRQTACVQTNRQIRIAGARPTWDQPVPATTTLRASGAIWTKVGDYQVTFSGNSTGACLVGGSMVGEWPDSDRWTKWHYRAGLRFSQPNFTVVGVHVVNAGDGIKPKDDANGSANGFDIEGAWIQHVHDDCVENDYANSGVIHDSLLDGCYVMFSSRPSSSRYDGRNQRMVIARNVGALEPMQSVYSGSSPGTGGFFKWSDQAPPVSLTDNVFMARQTPNHGTLGPPTGPLVCSRNVIVWTGRGAFPDAAAWHARCPDTVITTDVTRYTEARTIWIARHPAVR
jgi:hypothetical protein